jgi:hypothetical protein
MVVRVCMVVYLCCSQNIASSVGGFRRFELRLSIILINMRSPCGFFKHLSDYLMPILGTKMIEALII